MIPFHRFRDPQTGDEILETPLRGAMLLDVPMLNKGSAFTLDERREFELMGLLPPHVSSEEEQIARTYQNYLTATSDLERFIYLAGLQDRNETLFYRLVNDHMNDMLPIVYTPTVGQACQMYSQLLKPLVRHSVEEIGKAAEKAAELTRQMTAYAGRASADGSAMLSLTQLVREMRELIRVSVPGKVQVLYLLESPERALLRNAVHPYLPGQMV